MLVKSKVAGLGIVLMLGNLPYAYGAGPMKVSSAYPPANRSTASITAAQTALTLTPAVYPSNWLSGTSHGVVVKPSTNALRRVLSDSSIYTEDGSALFPFLQSSLTPSGPTGLGAINDPNAYVLSPTNVSYNLNWGTPDPAGPQFARLFPNQTNLFTFAPQMWGGSYYGPQISGNNFYYMTAKKPNADVIAAWNNGWTGKGQNILVIDDQTGLMNGKDGHAAITSFLAGYYTAPGATTYMYDFNYYGSVYRNDQSSRSIVSDAKNIQIINASYEYVGRTADSRTVNILNGTMRVAQLNLTDAVVSMAAGNSKTDTGLNATRTALLADSSLGQRLILVGATTADGTVASRTSLASYSNFAGSNPATQARFLVANGTAPWATTTVLYNFKLGSKIGVSTSSAGTSFAAPRVAGYAAIVRQKFPNLTGVNTANILLSTARYDTLSCYPNCNKSIYGQGEASLSRALAPVGYLR